MKLWTDERTDGRRTTEPAYTISSTGAFGSGEIKMHVNVYCFNFSAYIRFYVKVLIEKTVNIPIALNSSDAYQSVNNFASHIAVGWLVGWLCWI